MKTISLYYILLFLILFLASFKYILNGCKYSKNSTSEELDTDNTNYLGQLTGDAAKIKCFILSNTIHADGLWCYNNKTNKCVSKNETETGKIEAEGTTGNGEISKDNGTRRIE